MDSVEEGSAILEMSKEVYVAAVEGNLHFLEQTQNDAYLLSKTHENNTIIHIAVQHEQYEFTQQSLQRLVFPNNNKLICEKNSSGNTALHVAAEVGNLSIVKLLGEYDDDYKPWRLKNLKGNTPIHVAIMHHNVNIATFLLDKDPFLARMLNVFNEAPLHLALKHHVDYFESELVMEKIKQPIEKGGAALASNYTNVRGEDMSSVIKLLIEKGSCVTCWRDKKGRTPLHAAASLNIPYNLEVIRSMLQHCPQSAEVCDNTGKSILHLLISKIHNYQEGISLLKFKQIYALRNHQDHQGNTPLHLAAKNMDIHMVRVLLESSTKLSIKNMEGLSVASFIQQKNLLQMLRKRKMTLAESEAANKGNITFLRERMSKLELLDFLHSQDSQGRNMLHKLMHIKNNTHINVDDFVDFIGQVVESFPEVICQTDQNGDTPVHVLVRNHLDTKIYVAKSSENFDGHDGDTEQKNSDTLLPLWRSNLLSALLALCIGCSNKIHGTTIKPWFLVQNFMGNTPLHEAIMANNNNLVTKLLHFDHKSAGLRNNCKETPLHLIAKCYSINDTGSVTTEDIASMVRAKVKAAYWVDEDGMTPLVRAIEAGNISIARLLCAVAPKSMKITNANGETFWHLLANNPSSYYVYLLLKTPHSRDQLSSKDKNGNTMLHLAIEANRFDIVITFFQVWDEQPKFTCERKWLLDLFAIKNKAGKSPADLIGESKSLPNTGNEKFVEDKLEKLCIRSVWGIPTIHVKNYVSTMGVVAALITTITFTAAFTVPGGLFQDKGTPIFLKKPAFQVFMISDMVAMCLSMMVLFCLLWIMVGGKRQNSLRLLDFSVTLLVASFFATLLTFMTGLFAVMVPIKPWIAYANLGLCSLFLVLCSLPLLILHKFAIIKSLIPLRIIAACFFSWTWACFSATYCSASLCIRKWREQPSRSAHRRHRSFINVV